MRYIIYLLLVFTCAYIAVYAQGKQVQKVSVPTANQDTEVLHDTVYIQRSVVAEIDSECRGIVQNHISDWEEHIDNWTSRYEWTLLIFTVIVTLIGIVLPIWSHYTSSKEIDKIKERLDKIKNEFEGLSNKIKEKEKSIDDLSKTIDGFNDQLSELNEKAKEVKTLANVLNALQALITLNGLRDFYRKNALIYNDLDKFERILDDTGTKIEGFLNSENIDNNRITYLIIFQQIKNFLQRYEDYIRGPKYLYLIEDSKTDIDNLIDTALQQSPIDIDATTKVLTKAFKTINDALNDELKKHIN